MKEQAELLNRLGKCDYRLHKLKNSINTKPDELLTVEKKQATENKHCRSLNAQITEREKRIGEFSGFIELEKEKLALSEKQLMELKGQKVFLKVKNNISTINKFIKQSEEAAEKLKSDLEVLKEKLKESLSSIDNLADTTGKLISDHDESTAVFLEEVKILEEERAEISKQINGKLLWKYNKLLEKGLFPPVAEVKTNYCSQCSMEFPPQIFQQLLTDSIGECSNCLRIIVQAAEEDKEDLETVSE